MDAATPPRLSLASQQALHLLSVRYLSASDLKKRSIQNTLSLRLTVYVACLCLCSTHWPHIFFGLEQFLEVFLDVETSSGSHLDFANVYIPNFMFVHLFANL